MNSVRKSIIKIVVNNTINCHRTTYKSALSLDKLYPNSSLKLTTPDKPVNVQNEAFSGIIPIDQLEITYSRSSGPGGQNVNKVNTKVDIRFHLLSAKWLNEDVKNKLAAKHTTKLTKEGYLVFRSDLTRSQQLNVADCLEKIRSTIRNCLQPEPTITEETEEKIRRRHERAARERLAIKRNRSQVKNVRQGPSVRDII